MRLFLFVSSFGLRDQWGNVCVFDEDGSAPALVGELVWSRQLVYFEPFRFCQSVPPCSRSILFAPASGCSTWRSSSFGRNQPGWSSYWEESLYLTKSAEL